MNKNFIFFFYLMPIASLFSAEQEQKKPLPIFAVKYPNQNDSLCLAIRDDLIIDELGFQYPNRVQMNYDFNQLNREALGDHAGFCNVGYDRRSCVCGSYRFTFFTADLPAEFISKCFGGMMMLTSVGSCAVFTDYEGCCPDCSGGCCCLRGMYGFIDFGSLIICGMGSTCRKINRGPQLQRMEMN